ncbi:MAG: hypothetical protein EZS28_034089, partial [Streblomastix strix]
MVVIVVHFIFYVNCQIVNHVSRVYNLGETTEIKEPQSQTTQQNQTTSLASCCYKNVAIIIKMKIAEYFGADNENSPNFVTRQELDSPTLDHVTFQENSIKYEGVQFIYHDNQKGIPQILENDSKTLAKLENFLIWDLRNQVLVKFVNEVSIAMCYSSLIALFNQIFIILLARAIMTAFLPRKIVNYKSQSLQQKKYDYKLVIILLIIAYYSIFEVATDTNYLINSEFDGVASQNIVVDQPTDEFKVISCTFRNCGNDEIEGGALYINISNKGRCKIINSSFINCSAFSGGAIYATINRIGAYLLCIADLLKR